jgi:hypothetical protein
MDNQEAGPQRLELGATGTWAVRSASATVYYFDLDAGLLLRQPGEGSSRGPFDGVWVPLVSVEAPGENNVVQVGRRHRYTLDPDPGGRGDYIWWIQRTVTAIDPVTPGEKPSGRVPGCEEYGSPFGL